MQLKCTILVIYYLLFFRVMNHMSQAMSLKQLSLNPGEYSSD